MRDTGVSGGHNQVTAAHRTLLDPVRGPKRGSVCAISGWCKSSGPCEGDVKTSLPFHGALIWPFHWVKPKEIHVYDLCGASLHSGTGRKKQSSWLGMKRAGLCAHRTHDPWTLTFKKYHEGEGGLWFDWKSNIGIVNIAWQTSEGMMVVGDARIIVTNMKRRRKEKHSYYGHSELLLCVFLLTCPVLSCAYANTPLGGWLVPCYLFTVAVSG